MKKSQGLNTLTFGEYFRQKRIKLGLTLRAFCDKYRYDPGNISRLERNIMPPTIDDEKLEGYALALGIKRDSPDWTIFFDLAHTTKGALPKDIMRDVKILSLLPAFYRTARGDKLTKSKIKQLLKLLGSSQ